MSHISARISDYLSKRRSSNETGFSSVQLYKPKEQASNSKDRYSSTPQLLYRGERSEGVPVRHCTILKDLPFSVQKMVKPEEEVKLTNELYFT